MEERFYRFRQKYQWLLMAVGALLTIALSGALYHSYTYAQQKAMDMAVSSLKSVVKDAFNIINKVQTAADVYVPQIEHNLDNPDQMFTLSQDILRENPSLKGCSISFEPNFFQEKGKYFSAYSYNRGDTIVTEQEGDDGYQYFYMDWYLIPRQLNKKYWIEPYTEQNTDGIIVNDIMTSYCQPLYDSKGETIGVLSADLPLKWLSDIILSHHPMPQSYCMLVGRGGTYIVHPDSTKLMTESILTPTLEGEHPELMKLGRAMIGGETGLQALKINGVKSHVFYMPFARTGWSLALVCPTFALMKNYYMVAFILVLLIAFSAVIMLTPLWNFLARRRHQAATAVMALILLLGFASCGQSENSTTVKKHKNAVVSEKIRTEATNKIVSAGLNNDPHYFALVDSLEEADCISILEAEYWRADHYYDLQKFRSAIIYYKKALANDELKDYDIDLYYKALQGLYTASFNSNNLKESLTTSTKAYQEASEDTTASGQMWAASFKAAIGSSLLKLGSPEEAARNYISAGEKAEEIAIANPLDKDIQETSLLICSNIINNYLNRHEFEKAALWLKRMERALERLASTDVDMKVYEEYLASTLSDKAVIFYKTGRRDEAENAYRSFLATSKADTYSGIYDQAYYLEVTEQWNKLLAIQLKIDSSEVAEGIAPTLDYLIESPSTTFKALVNTGRKDEAIKKATSIIQLLDSVKMNQHRSDAEELAVIYETQQKEEQIALQQAELSQQRFQGLAIFVVLIVIFFLVYTNMRVQASRRLGKMKAAQERIEGELQIARDIQISMLPHQFPQREGLDMYAAMTPAREVGGDLYDYVLQDDHLYFCVGDVSGKGVPASLFMAQATSLFRTMASQGMQPAEICTHMNNLLTGDNNESGMFVTFFLGLIDMQTGHLSFCNAGHNPPVIGGNKEHGNFLEMESNAPIGLWPDLQFVGEEIATIKGCPLFLYTDGLNEAENRQQVQFGDDQLLDILRNTRFENAHQVIDTLTAAVEKHRDGAEPNDDLTLMCIRVY